MPTQLQRINVTLSPSIHSLVERLATIQRVSKSSVVREFLEAVAPQLEAALAMMEAARSAKPKALQAIRSDLDLGLKRAQEAADLAMASAAGITRDLVAESQTVRGRRPGRHAPQAQTVGSRSQDRYPPTPMVSVNPPSSNRGVKSPLPRTGREKAGSVHKPHPSPKRGSK
mgnify:CR=1 FL=1